MANPRLADDPPEHVAERLNLWASRRRGIALVTYRDHKSLTQARALLDTLCAQNGLSLQSLDISDWDPTNFALHFDQAREQHVGPWSILGFSKLLPLESRAFFDFILQLNMLRDRLDQVPQIWWVPPFMERALAETARDLDSFFELRLTLRADPFLPPNPHAGFCFQELEKALGNPLARQSGAIFASYLEQDGDPLKIADPAKTWFMAHMHLPEASILSEFLRITSPDLFPYDPLPAQVRLPFARNFAFVGRQEELTRLGEALNTSDRVVLAGMAGIGKTQLAVEYCFRYGNLYPGGLFWLNAAQPDRTIDDIVACGSIMGLFPIDDQTSRENKRQRVIDAWSKDKTPRLLVLDNCEDEHTLEEWGNCLRSNKVLITSRKQSWTKGTTVLNLNLLERTQSIDLLHKSVPSLTDSQANAIATELGDLPLALFLAARYLEHNAMHPELYLETLKDKKLDHASLANLATAGYQPTHYDLGVGRSLALSYERLTPTSAEDVLAKKLLVHISCFAPGEPILFEHLRQTLDKEEGEMAEGALERLRRLGLVEKHDNKILAHRLVCHFSHELNAEDWEKAEPIVIQTVVEIADEANQSFLPANMNDILPHLRYLAEKHYHQDSFECAQLTLELGRYLQIVADYSGAERWYQRSLACANLVLGQEAPELANFQYHLADLYQATNRLGEAEPLLKMVLANGEKAMGANHPIVALFLNNLAGLLQATNRLIEAEPLIRRALAINEATFGVDHPHVANSLNNLANFLYTTDRLTEAEPLIRRALAINEAALGVDHPNVANNLNNLAQVLRVTNRLAEAEPLIRRALAINEATLGDDHPNVAISLNNLAMLLQAANRLAEAEPLMRRALAIQHASLGQDHPYTQNTIAGLDHLLAQLDQENQVRQAFG